MTNFEGAAIPPRIILAAFTYARRKHLGLTKSHLAHALGIRFDQVDKAEAGRPCGAKATQVLLKWNGLAPSISAGAGDA